MGIAEVYLRDAIVRQVEKYGPVLEKTIQQKIFLYSHKNGRYLRDQISLCWIKTYDKIRELVGKGVLANFRLPKSQERWLIMPNYLWGGHTVPDDVMEKARRRMDLMVQYRTSINGRYAEEIVAKAFMQKGYGVLRNTRPEDAQGNRMEVDVLATKGGRAFMIEVKNRYSDCFFPPLSGGGSRGGSLTEQRRVWDFCEFVVRVGGTPVLIASLADRSLTGWIKKFDGMYMCLLYQILPPGCEEVAGALRKEFGLGHVQCFADPPKNIGMWIASNLG